MQRFTMFILSLAFVGAASVSCTPEADYHKPATPGRTGQEQFEQTPLPIPEKYEDAGEAADTGEGTPDEDTGGATDAGSEDTECVGILCP